jgi:hypothetical protein
MIRKLILAFGAAIVIGAAALSPTAVFAHWHHHWHGFRWGWGYGSTYVVAPGCYVVKRTVEWPDGSLHLRHYRVCN